MNFSQLAGQDGLFCDGDWIEKKDQDVNGNVRLIQLADIGEGTFKDKSSRHVTEDTAHRLNCTFLQQGDILIARLPDPLGRACIFPLKGNFITAVDIAILRIKSHAYNPRYVMYMINSPQFRKEISLYESGTTRKRISRKNLDKIQFNLPDLSTQESVVSKIEELFSRLDASVAELQTAKEKLKVYRQAAITQAFPVLFEGRTVKLSDIASVSGGITKGRKLDNCDILTLPYLRVANVQNGFLDLQEVKTIQLKQSEKDKYLLKYGDVLYTEGGDRDKLGRGTVWRNEIEPCVHQNHVFKARLDLDRAIPEYVAYWSMSTPARNYFYQKGKQSVNLASINKTVLSNLLLPLPPVADQQKIIEAISSRISVADNIEQSLDISLRQAESLRQSILKLAFEGRLIDAF